MTTNVQSILTKIAGINNNFTAVNQKVQNISNLTQRVKAVTAAIRNKKILRNRKSYKRKNVPIWDFYWCRSKG